MTREYLQGLPDKEAVQVGALPFMGWDLWQAWEVSWLNVRGLPQVAILKVQIPCDSPNIVESKSFKLYLNSLNQTRFENAREVQATVERDLQTCVGTNITTEWVTAQDFAQERIVEPSGICLDTQDIEISVYEPDANFLSADPAHQIHESVYSRLLKSNCPVTGQPDWACVYIDYSGAAIDHAGLLRYIVSYRNHQGFHELCVEQIFCDIMRQCAPESLSVYARYTRRGGLDINPWRATPGHDAPSRLGRTARQ